MHIADHQRKTKTKSAKEELSKLSSWIFSCSSINWLANTVTLKNSIIATHPGQNLSGERVVRLNWWVGIASSCLSTGKLAPPLRLGGDLGHTSAMKPSDGKKYSRKDHLESCGRLLRNVSV